VFVVRPVFRHFVWWLLFAPVVLFEIHALDHWLATRALEDPGRYHQAVADITAYNQTAYAYNIRYTFRIPGDPEQYTAADLLGRTDLWTRVTREAWETARRDGDTLRVLYLPEQPWVNQPASIAGNPAFDSFGGWLIFLIFDLFWLFETWLIGRNFLRCQVAAERQQVQQVRFWRTLPV
jgi:hypothetical protein